MFVFEKMKARHVLSRHFPTVAPGRAFTYSANPCAAPFRPGENDPISVYEKSLGEP